MQDKIKTHFSKTVADYDTVADDVVFKNNELHRELVNAVPFEKNRELEILDLGCWTGHGMEVILEEYPKAKITGVDFSATMIQRTKENLSYLSNRIDLWESDFMEFEFEKRYDVVISAVAIHNITHEEKKVLFEKIYDCLNDWGVFINADFYEHESDSVNEKLKKVYRKYLEQNLNWEELEVWLRHAFEEDMPMSLSKQESILKKVWFKEFNLCWLFNNEAVYIAKK